MNGIARHAIIIISAAAAESSSTMPGQTKSKSWAANFVDRLNEHGPFNEMVEILKRVQDEDNH